MKWFCLFFLQASVFASAQQPVITGAVEDSIIKQITLFPQEKIHLHTDRTMYVPGEKIWFKAYIVDALTHQSAALSQYVYVELINPSDSLVHRVMVCCDDHGLFHGYVFLSDMIPEGDYTLRAYTRYMENTGDDYFFMKAIRIGSLAKASKSTAKPPGSDYDVSFFPEGGNLAEGVRNRVAFKALNRLGASEFITGAIVDKEGNQLCDVTTVFAGMGSFMISPEAGKTYFLQSKNSNGREKRFQLPIAKKACSLGVLSRNKRHIISLIKTPDEPAKLFYLLVHCKGEIFYFSEWNQPDKLVTLTSDQLPAGVIQILLFDEQMNPVSERLVFNRQADQTHLVFSQTQPLYNTRERVAVEIFITDTEGSPLKGNVSVAVTDDKDIAIDSLHTITASLLLSSELRGTVESPGFYLQDDPVAEFALDHLMMTHGWRRYDLPEAIKGNYRIPETGFEVMKEISGSLKSNLSGKPVVNGEVLYIGNDGSYGQTTTDSAGLFGIYHHYPDSTMFSFQARNQKGRDGVKIELDQEKFPKLKHIPANMLLSYTDRDKDKDKQLVKTEPASEFIKKAGQRAQYDDGMRLIHLGEVTVTAKRVDKRDEIRSKY